MSVWLLGATLSFVDGRPAVSSFSAQAGGIAAAFLLGNLRDAVRTRLGLAVALGGAVLIVYNNPGRALVDVVFIPVLVAIGWVAGFALRERSAQAEAAEERATYAEREREAVARIAVAEERCADRA